MNFLDKMLLGSSSMRAVFAGLGLQPETTALKDRATVTPKIGKRSKPNRRIISYERSGPFYTQSGTQNIAGNILPILYKFYEHRFLHATKGWRVYHGGNLFRLPSAVTRPGFQVFRRSTWMPNARERRLGLVPRPNENDAQRAPLAACYA